MRVRHFGFLAKGAKKHALPQCRKLLGLNPALPEIPKKSPQELMLELTGIDISLCKKETLRIVADLQRSLRWTPHDKRTDSPALLSLNVPPTQGYTFGSTEIPLPLFIYTSEALRYNPTTSRCGSVPATSSITASTSAAFCPLQYP